MAAVVRGLWRRDVGGVRGVVAQGTIICLRDHLVEMQDGMTALLEAASCGHAGIVALLVDRGADLEARAHVSPSLWRMTSIRCQHQATGIGRQCVESGWGAMDHICIQDGQDKRKFQLGVQGEGHGLGPTVAKQYLDGVEAAGGILHAESGLSPGTVCHVGFHICGEGLYVTCGEVSMFPLGGVAGQSHCTDGRK